MNVRGIVAAALAAPCLALPGTADAAAPAPATCAKADSLRDTAQLDDARKEYAAAQAAGAGECVHSGLKDLALRYRDKGDRLLSAQLVEQATAAYAVAVELDPTLSGHVVGKIGSKRAFEIAEQLRGRGLETEARQLVVDALKRHPGVTPSPPALERLLEDTDRTGWWQDFVDDAAPYGRTVAEVLIAGLVALVLAQFAFTRVHKRLVLGTFLGPVGEETKQTRASTEFQSLVRVRIDGLASEQDAGRIDFASPEGASVVIPAAVTQAVPQASLADAAIHLVQHLIPARNRTLTCTLLSAVTPGGIGVSMTMDSRFAGPRTTHVVRADDLPPVAFLTTGRDSYLPFAVVVAAWALAEFRPRRFRALGTADPLSYAAFALAAHAETEAP